MIYEWIAQRTNQNARKLAVLLLFGASALMLFTVLIQGMPFRWVFQLIAVGLLIGMIFLVARYESKLYFYRLERDGDEGIDLTVTEANAKGRAQVTVCRIALRQIRDCVSVDITKADGKEILSVLKKEKKKRFDYCADYRPQKSILLLVEEGDEELAIRLSYDDRLFELLTNDV